MSEQANPNCQHPSEARCTCKNVGLEIEKPIYPTAMLVTYTGELEDKDERRPLWLSKECYDYLRSGGDPYAHDELPVMGSNQAVSTLGDEWDGTDNWLHYLACEAWGSLKSIPGLYKWEGKVHDVIKEALETLITTNEYGDVS